MTTTKDRDISVTENQLDKNPQTKEVAGESFAETALRLGGKSAEESSRTGKVDKADDEVEALFAPEYKTVNSPAHRAVWEDNVPLKLFESMAINEQADCVPAMEKSLDVLRDHRKAGTIWDEKGKVSDKVLRDLSDAGYWGMLIDKKYGGQGASRVHFMDFLTKVASIDPTTAGLASVHGCIGAVDPVASFGTDEQKKEFLPRLASGKSLSAFALTEPNAGSDLTALRTTATLDGDHYVINGEKLFITNAQPGRTIGIVCLVDDKPAAIIADLPEQENENFKIVNYGIHALKHAYNVGLVFKDFRVPKENLLKPKLGDGLTVAYHGLNMGRLALCANASGVMRVMLANMLPWAHFRETYGQAIESRELVKKRIARTAGLICGADALVSWGASLLDRGYRGELECIIAKIFGSEAEKEVAIEHFMKTHGGRSFLEGHLLGDNIHDFLAPSIYEGEGEMLGMAFFKSLAKEHGKKFFEPVGLALQRNNMRDFDPFNPAHVWALRNELVPYAFWWFGQNIKGPDQRDLDFIAKPLHKHVDFAIDMLSNFPLELSGAMVKHQLKLADRQCRIAHMSQRVQDTITMLVTCLWANKEADEVTIAATDILCRDLTMKLTGEPASDRYFRKCSKLADMVIDGGFKPLEGIEREDILFSYDKA